MKTNELSKFAHVYDQVMDQQLTRNGRSMQFVLFLVPKDRFVKYGTGLGTVKWSMRLDDKGYEVIGVDLIQEYVRNC